jgi:hypothetical protein
MVTEKSKENRRAEVARRERPAILGVFMLEGMMIGSIGTISAIATGLSWRSA